jgi:hypothetical protein
VSRTGTPAPKLGGCRNVSSWDPSERSQRPSLSFIDWGISWQIPRTRLPQAPALATIWVRSEIALLWGR